MSRTKVFKELSSTDPRERRASEVEVGDRLVDSHIEAIRKERRRGRAGLRIVLRDGRRAWMRPDTKVYSVDYTKP